MDTKEIQEEIEKLPNDTVMLNLDSRRVTSLAGVKFPDGLKVLDLRHTPLTDLNGVELPSGLQQLSLSGTKLNNLLDLHLPEGLLDLDLSFTPITNYNDLSDYQSEETQIRNSWVAYLVFHYNYLYGSLPGKLQTNDICKEIQSSIDFLRFPSTLQSLDLSYTNISRIPQSIRKLKNLRTLNLCGLELEEIPDWILELGLPITRNNSSYGIDLSGTTIKGVDMSIFDQSQETVKIWLQMEFLRRASFNVSDFFGSSLDMRMSGMSALPRLYDSSGTLVKSFSCPVLDSSPFLYRFDERKLHNNKPDYLEPRYGFDAFDFEKYYYQHRYYKYAPFDVGHFRSIRWVCSRYTPPGCFDNEDWDPKTYRPAYVARRPIYAGEVPEPVEEPAKPLNELKVVFLGDGGAGKSHTIARLLKDDAQTEDFPDISTPGIVIQDKTYSINGRNIKVHFWDFGGQEILHSMHRMFLTERTLYVVMLNVRDGNQDERARYWLHNLRSFANGAPVLLVLNQMDMNKNASINESDLRKLYPGLTQIVKLSTLKYSDAEFHDHFTKVLLEQIGSMNILEYPFIPSWKRLKEKLQNMKQNYIKGKIFREYCDNSGVTGSDTVRRDLLNWFSDLGVSFCYSGSAKLEDYVVLRPDWITNAIYIILFNKVQSVKNGLVSHDTIYQMLSSADTEEVRRTVAAATYEQEEVDYVLNVFRKFRLSFQVENENTEFLPMLCDANATAASTEYEDDPNALEFRMHYEYLPNNVIHRLMVERRAELDQNNVWLFGARFVCGETGRSAVVKTEGNLLRILVRAEKDPRDPQRYLDELKDNLERINAIMGLTVAKTEIAYKEGGKTEYFDYETVLMEQEFGGKDILSKVHRKRILLADVLMQSDFPEDEKQKKLFSDIRSSCQKLQNRKIYYDASEDQRTDYLMDMLSNDYFVSPQYRGGISAGGIQSGELDLDIRLDPADAWTALEALNLKGSSSSQIEYWDAHLKKLLDNYNEVGRAFLFHVSYVSCQKDKFHTICNGLYEHLRFYSPRGFELLRRFVTEVRSDDWEENRFLRTFKCVYDCGGIPMTVYHFFVRIGE